MEDKGQLINYSNSDGPPAIERLLSPVEAMASLLCRSWANRLDREVQILVEKLVDESKLKGLLDLRAEMERAGILLEAPSIVYRPDGPDKV